jgi:hypothetical protein
VEAAPPCAVGAGDVHRFSAVPVGWIHFNKLEPRVFLFLHFGKGQFSLTKD